jgi:hypothetical protein
VAEKWISFGLKPLHDDWDDLVELLDALQEYAPDSKTEVYAALQAIAEGVEADLRVSSNQAQEFVAHMREFGIEAKPEKS